MEGTQDVCDAQNVERSVTERRGAQGASLETIQLLRDLRKKVVVGVVEGSDFVKISEQLSVHGAISAYSLYSPTPLHNSVFLCSN